MEQQQLVGKFINMRYEILFNIFSEYRKKLIGGTRVMKIVNCPKGGRVPEGYCLRSCLNYRGEPKNVKWISLQKLSKILKSIRKTWIQVYNEELLSMKKDKHRKRRVSC